MSGSLTGFKCHTCTIPLSLKITVSDRNSNMGRHFISVRPLWCQHGSLLMHYDIQCSGTEGNPHVLYFCFVEDLPPSAPPQTPVYNPQLLTTRATSQQHAAGEFQARCRINIKCVRNACATHCRALGGCPVDLHQRDGTILMPSASQSFEPVSAFPWSQPTRAASPVPAPTSPPLCNSPPSPVSILTAGSSVNQPPDEHPPPPPPVNTDEAPNTSLHAAEPLSSTNLPSVSEAPGIVSPFPTRIIAEPPSSMNPPPNP